MRSSPILLTTLLSALATAAPTESHLKPRTDAAALTESLLSAHTARDRANLLPDPAQHVFDFNNPPEGSVATGKGGHTVRADRATFPALTGTGVSMVLGFLGPCGFNTPHTHPRSSEINIPVKGSLVTQHTEENGTPTILNTIKTNQVTVFPKGALHTEFNPDCEDTLFVAGFGDEDPGVMQIAQTFFGLREDILTATLGGGDAFAGEDLEALRKMIPANVALGVEECLAKCGIQRK